MPWFLLGESGDTTRGPIPLYAEPLRTISDDEYPEPVRVADAHAVVAKPGDDAGAKPFGGITSIHVEELVRSFFKNANLTFKDEKNISFFVKAVRVFFTDSELIALTKGGDIPPHILAQQLLCSSLDVQMRWDQMLHQIVLVGNFIAAITPRWHTRLPITEGQHMALREALFLDSAADLEAIIQKPGKDGAVQFADILARLDDQGVYLSSAIPIPEATLDNIIKGLIGFVRSIAEPGRIKVNDPRIPSLAEIAPYLFTYLEVDDFFGQVVARGKQFGSEVEFNAAAANAVGRRLCLNSPEPWKGETGKIDRLTILLSVGNVMKVIHSVYSDIMLGI